MTLVQVDEATVGLCVSAVGELVVVDTGTNNALQSSSAVNKREIVMLDLLVYFGSPATLVHPGPVALRPRLTTGLPFR